jgi:hypothetical protein
VDRVETIDRAIEDYDERIDDERPRIEPDSPCVCGHVFDEHQPRCVAIVAVHERREYCGCTEFELDEEALATSTGGYRD